MGEMMRRILLLDDEPSVLHALQRALRPISKKNNLEICLCGSPKEAIPLLGLGPFEFVISDYHMPGMTGVDFLRIAKEVQPEMVRLMLSASADFNTIMGAVNEAEVFRYIVKPWNPAELEETVLLALEHRKNLLEEKQLAGEMRARLDAENPQEAEAKRLEEAEPGITKVKWGPGGSVLLDD
jgi:DNA-binding NtrC family response regulator